MIEGGVNDTVRLGRPAPKALRIFQVASMYLGSGRDQRLGAFVRPRQSKHLMASLDEFWNDDGTDEAGRAGDEYAHG